MIDVEEAFLGFPATLTFTTQKVENLLTQMAIPPTIVRTIVLGSALFVSVGAFGVVATMPLFVAFVAFVPAVSVLVGNREGHQHFHVTALLAFPLHWLKILEPLTDYKAWLLISLVFTLGSSSNSSELIISQVVL